MVAAKQIQTYAASVARTFRPERIVLFGSCARGAHTPDSDVDILVIMRHRKRNVEQALEIDRRMGAWHFCGGFPHAGR